MAPPKPTALNHLPLLYALFDIGGIATPKADDYEAYLAREDERMQLEYEAAINDLGDDVLPGVSTLARL